MQVLNRSLFCLCNSFCESLAPTESCCHSDVIVSSSSLSCCSRMPGQNAPRSRQTSELSPRTEMTNEAEQNRNIFGLCTHPYMLRTTTSLPDFDAVFTFFPPGITITMRFKLSPDKYCNTKLLGPADILILLENPPKQNSS